MRPSSSMEPFGVEQGQVDVRCAHPGTVDADEPWARLVMPKHPRSDHRVALVGEPAVATRLPGVRFVAALERQDLESVLNAPDPPVAHLIDGERRRRRVVRLRRGEPAACIEELRRLTDLLRDARRQHGLVTVHHTKAGEQHLVEQCVAGDGRRGSHPRDGATGRQHEPAPGLGVEPAGPRSGATGPGMWTCTAAPGSARTVPVARTTD